MEDAELPESHFDIAYSCMVMEHVEHPEPFFQAVYRCLKPGGRYYFMTPNGRHYFGLITTAMHRLHLDEIALRLACGKQRTDVYHYPVQYRCNTPKSVTTAAVNAGFEPPEFVFAEQVGPTPYFRGPLRLFVKAMDLKRRVIRKPECLLDMIVRVTKPATPST